MHGWSGEMSNLGKLRRYGQKGRMGKRKPYPKTEAGMEEKERFQAIADELSLEPPGWKRPYI